MANQTLSGLSLSKQTANSPFLSTFGLQGLFLRSCVLNSFYSSAIFSSNHLHSLVATRSSFTRFLDTAVRIESDVTKRREYYYLQSVQYFGPTSGVVSFIECTFIECHGTDDGGAILMKNANNLNVEFCTFVKCQAKYTGSAIRAQKSENNQNLIDAENPIKINSCCFSELTDQNADAAIFLYAKVLKLSMSSFDKITCKNAQIHMYGEQPQFNNVNASNRISTGHIFLDIEGFLWAANTMKFLNIIDSSGVYAFRFFYYNGGASYITVDSANIVGNTFSDTNTGIFDSSKDQSNADDLIILQNLRIKDNVFTPNAPHVYRSGSSLMQIKNSIIDFSNPYGGKTFENVVWNSQNLATLDMELYGQCPRITEKFSPSSVMTKSTQFTYTSLFDKTNSYTLSHIFSISKEFGATKKYSFSNKFSSSEKMKDSKDFSKSLDFIPSDENTNLAKKKTTEIFSSSFQFIATGDFIQSKIFSQSVEMTCSKEFVPSTSFTSSSNFKQSILFSISKYFSNSIQMTDSSIYSLSKEFSISTNFNPSRPFSSSSILSSSKNFKSSDKFSDSNGFYQTEKFSLSNALSGSSLMSNSVKFIQSQQFSKSKILSESREFKPSIEFSTSTNFHQSNIFSNSYLLSNSKQMSNSIIFMESSGFSASANFIHSNMFSISQKFLKTGFFSESNKNSASDIFLHSKDFSKSLILTASDKLSQSEDFINSDKFSISNIFKSSKDFSSSIDFIKTQEMSKSNSMTGSSRFIETNIFSQSVQNSKTIIFTESCVFTYSEKPVSTNQFTDSHDYSQSKIFIPTGKFKASKIFSKTNQFINTDKFSLSSYVENFMNHYSSEIIINDKTNGPSSLNDEHIQEYTSRIITYNTVEKEFSNQIIDSSLNKEKQTTNLDFITATNLLEKDTETKNKEEKNSITMKKESETKMISTESSLFPTNQIITSEKAEKTVETNDIQLVSEKPNESQEQNKQSMTEESQTVQNIMIQSETKIINVDISQQDKHNLSTEMKSSQKDSITKFLMQTIEEETTNNLYQHSHLRTNLITTETQEGQKQSQTLITNIKSESQPKTTLEIWKTSQKDKNMPESIEESDFDTNETQTVELVSLNKSHQQLISNNGNEAVGASKESKAGMIAGIVIGVIVVIVIILIILYFIVFKKLSDSASVTSISEFRDVTDSITFTETNQLTLENFVGMEDEVELDEDKYEYTYSYEEIELFGNMDDEQ